MDIMKGPYARSRSRKTHTKSRLGCMNCKKRRIKCDEARPECANCIGHSVECKYEQPLKRHTSTSSASSSSLPTPRNSKSDERAKGPKNEHAFISSFQPGFTVPKRSHCETKSNPMQLPPSSPQSTVIQRPFQFTANDMALLHHCTSTEELKAHLPDELIKLSFSVHYILHLLLAISGFHLKRKPESNNIGHFMGSGFDCYIEAERHLKIATSLLTAVDPQLHQENGHLIYIASLFIFICSLARGPQPNEYLAFRNDDDLPTMCLFMSMRSILEANHSSGASQNISEVQPRQKSDIALEQNLGIALQQDDSQGIKDLSGLNVLVHDLEGTNAHWSQQLNNLRILIRNEIPFLEPRYSAYNTALELLWSRYESILGTATAFTSTTSPDLWPQIFSWLYLLPDGISAEMQQRHPLALLLFSYFAVLLNKLDSVWFIRGWPTHIVTGISHSLDTLHRPFLSWPLKQLLPVVS